PFHCEPFGRAPCARFRPMVSYRAVQPPEHSPPATGEFATWKPGPFYINTAQRMRFFADKHAHGRAAIGYDCEQPSAECTLPPQPVVWVDGNPLDRDGEFAAISGGLRGIIDHFHQTPIGAVDAPGLTHFGCPECVHMHWRWSKDLMNLIGEYFPGGPRGK